MMKHISRAAKPTFSQKNDTQKKIRLESHNRQHEVIGRVTDPEFRTYGFKIRSEW